MIMPSWSRGIVLQLLGQVVRGGVHDGESGCVETSPDNAPRCIFGVDYSEIIERLLLDVNHLVGQLPRIPIFPAQAQSLGYEGPTGVFVTPLASTAASPAHGAGHPVIAYHLLAGGPVIGTWNTVSITEGFAKRFEFGYTREDHAAAIRPA
jgi:hypothetical protein